MDRRFLVLALLVVAALLAACAGGVRTKDDPPEKLYLALKIEDAGHVLAKPRLLGETGRKVSLRLLDPNRPEHERLSLELMPQRQGSAYEVAIGLTLDTRHERAEGSLKLKHGEERKVLLASDGRPVGVTLLLMRIDSPEFEAWMELVKQEQARQTS